MIVQSVWQSPEVRDIDLVETNFDEYTQILLQMLWINLLLSKHWNQHDQAKIRLPHSQQNSKYEHIVNKDVK